MGPQLDREGITADQGPKVIGLAMHDRLGHVRRIAGPPRPGKYGSGRQAKPLQAFFIGLMAPAQQLVEMHHGGGVGVAEAHAALELQPGGGSGIGGNTARSLERGRTPGS